MQAEHGAYNQGKAEETTPYFDDIFFFWIYSSGLRSHEIPPERWSHAPARP